MNQPARNTVSALERFRGDVDMYRKQHGRRPDCVAVSLDLAHELHAELALIDSAQDFDLDGFLAAIEARLILIDDVRLVAIWH